MFNKGIRAQFSGNLTHEPDLRQITNARGETTFVCNLKVAVNERYTSNGIQQEKTTYVQVAAWGDVAVSHANNLVKGQSIIVEGTLESENGHPKMYQRSDGTFGASFNVRATGIEWGRLPRNAMAAVATPTPANSSTPTSRKVDPQAAMAAMATSGKVPITDDIPF